jgi:hypothetical protein
MTMVKFQKIPKTMNRFQKRFAGTRLAGRIGTRRPQVATVPQVRRIVKSALHKDEEEKYAIINQSYSVSTTPGLYVLTNTAQGSSGGTHVGDECRLKSLWFRYNLTVADASNALRVILFTWKPNLGYASPAALNILKTVTTPNQLTSAYQEDGEDMYHILYDRVHFVSAVGPVQAGGLVKRKLNQKMDFSTGSSNGSNNIYLLLVSDSGAASDPTFNFTSRVAFTDA